MWEYPLHHTTIKEDRTGPGLICSAEHPRRPVRALKVRLLEHANVVDHIELRANKIMHTELPSSLSPAFDILLVQALGYRLASRDIFASATGEGGSLVIGPQRRGHRHRDSESTLNLTCRPTSTSIYIVNLLLLPYSRP